MGGAGGLHVKATWKPQVSPNFSCQLSEAIPWRSGSIKGADKADPSLAHETIWSRGEEDLESQDHGT